MRPGGPLEPSERGPAGASVRPDWLPLDQAYAAYLDAHPAPAGGSLLAQTILTGPSRRRVLPLLDVREGADLLDLGTGFGPVVLEAGHLHRINGVGVDVDPGVLDVARGVGTALRAWLSPGASVRFELANATALPFEDATFDVVTARLLFQHLSDPRAVIEELERVLRGGGSVLVFDVDDGLSLTYPAPSEELAALESAFAACQSGRGGDREIGRKLTSLFCDAGFRIRTVELVAQAEHQASAEGDASRLVNATRLRNVREEIVRLGLLSAAEFDRCLDAYEHEPTVGRFRAESQLVVVAEKP